MAERRPPSIRGRQLAKELRLLRAADRRTGEQIGAQLGWSSAKVSRLETGRVPVTEEDLRKLLDVYGVQGDYAQKLINLARTANLHGWWDAYENVDREYKSLIGLEGEASAIYCYNPLVLHGLLQTEEYAGHIIGTRPVTPPGQVRQLTQIRLRRQQRLDGAEPLTFWSIIDEAAVRRLVGGPEVMRRQLQHLVELAERPNVTLQILPLSVGAHPGTSGSFSILEFSLADDRIVYLELMYESLYKEDEVDVHKYGIAFDDLQKKAMAPSMSLDFIAQMITELQYGR
jgi:transcriptional regulator with XRE-family HTH domain